MGEIVLKFFSLIFLLNLLPLHLKAQEIEFKLINQHKVKLKNFVVALYPLATKPVLKPLTLEILQKDKAFSPPLVVIPSGSHIFFPNKDDTSHSVYSFSQSKKFTVDLYKSTDKIPSLVFDQEGVVILGCNIHDWMSATIVIVDTAYYGLGQTESLVINDVPPGEYSVKVWHKNIDQEKLHTMPKNLIVTSEQKQSFDLNVEIKAGRK